MALSDLSPIGATMKKKLLVGVCILLFGIVILISDDTSAEIDENIQLFTYTSPEKFNEYDMSLATSPSESIELYEVNNLKYWVQANDYGEYYAQLVNIGIVTENQIIEVPEYIDYMGNRCKVISVGVIFQPFRIIGDYGEYIGHVGFTDNFADQEPPEFPSMLNRPRSKSVFENEPVHYSIVFDGDIIIRDYAFAEFNLFICAGRGEYCYTQSGLSSVTFNKDVTFIGKWAFAYTCIDKITISEEVTFVGDHAFYNSCLNDVNWDSDVDIPDYAFAHLYDEVGKISNLSISGSPNKIGENAFFGSAVTSLTIPDSVVEIGQHAFQNNKQLLSVTIGQGVNMISGGCFNGCNDLAEVCVRGTVKEIEASAFYGTSLRSFDFSNVETIGSYAFYSAFTGEDIVVLDLCNTKYIGDYAFCACTSPIDLRISSLEYVGKSGLAMSGELLDAEISLPNKCVLSEGALASLKVEKIIFGEECTIGTKALKNCTALDTVVFGDNCVLEDSIYSTSIFQGSTLRSVTIPSTLVVGKNAFQYCEFLETVVFEGERSRIGQWFYGCTNLTNITFPDGLVYIDDDAFYGCSKLDISDVPLNVTAEDVLSWGVRAFGGTASITENALFDNDLEGTISFLNVTLMKNGTPTQYSFMTDISGASNSMQLENPFAYYYTMPANLAGIYDSALMKPLPGLKFPNNLYLVDDERGTSSFAMYDRTGTILIKVPYNTEHLKIWENVTSIAPYACSNTQIEFISLPGSITEIGAYAFSFSKLEVIELNEGLIRIGDGAFTGTPLTKVRVPSTLEYVGDYAFPSAEIVIPEDSRLSHVGSQGMRIIEGGSVFIPSGLSDIGDLPFGYVLSSVYLGKSPSEYPDKMMRSSSVTMSAGHGTYISAHPTSLCFYLPLGVDASTLSFDMQLGCEGGYFGGYYVFADETPIVVDDKVVTNLGTVYIYSEIGTITDVKVDEIGETVKITLSLGTDWTVNDIEPTMSRGFVEVKDSTDPYKLVFFITGDVDGDVLRIRERMASESVTVTFDTKSGSECFTMTLGKGRTLSTNYPVPEKNCSEFLTWVDSDGTEYYPYTPINSNVVLSAVWKDADPRIIFDDFSHMQILVDGIPVKSGSRVGPNQIVSLSWEPTEGHTFSSWSLSDTSCTKTIESESYEFTINNDTHVTLSENYYNLSDHLRYEYSVDFSTDIQHLYLKWSTAYVQDTSGMVWTGGSSVPLVVDGRLYSRGGDYLYMYDMETGRILKKVSTTPFTGYYHYVGYANGMIFDYTSNKIYDKDLNYLRDMPYIASKVLWDDTGIYLVGGNGIFKYSLDLESLLWSFDLNSGYLDYTNYGSSGGIEIYDGYLYWVAVNRSREIVLQSLDVDTGTQFHQCVFSQYKNYLLDDGWITCCNNTVYVTIYSTGLFGEGSGGVSGGIIAIGINKGVFDENHSFYETNGKANSQLIVHNGRGYVNAGITFYVYDVDGTELTEIYRYTHRYFTHGGIILNDLPGDDKVEIMFVPYDPTCSVFVFYDSPGQTVPLYRNIAAEVFGQYNTQSVRFTDDGCIYFYNDSGNLFVLSAEDNTSSFLIILDDNTIVCSEYEGSFEEALSTTDCSRYAHRYMFSIGGKSLPYDYDASLSDNYHVFLLSDVEVNIEEIFEKEWMSDEYGPMTISDIRGGRLYLDGAEFFTKKDSYSYEVSFVDTQGVKLREPIVGNAPVGTSINISNLIDRSISGYSYKHPSSDVFVISCDESKNRVTLTYDIANTIHIDLRNDCVGGMAVIDNLQSLADSGDSVELTLPDGFIELDSSSVAVLAELHAAVSVGMSNVNLDDLSEIQRDAVPEGSVLLSIMLKAEEQSIHHLGGKAKVTVPVGDLTNGVDVFYLDDNGHMEKIDEVTCSDGKVTFCTTHFSYFVIVEGQTSDEQMFPLSIAIIVVAAIFGLMGAIYLYKKRE